MTKFAPIIKGILAGPAPLDVPPGPEGTEAVGGTTSYLDVLKRIHDRLAPELYVEIGVRTGKSLRIAACPSIGIDPDCDLRFPLPDKVLVFELTSDDFFEAEATDALTQKIDFSFIDGMHLFEYALRDFMYIESWAQANTLIVIDDVLPNHALQASRQRKTRVWTGDVWKLYYCLREYRPELTLLVLDTIPTGLLLVAGLDPNNRVLWNDYNRIVAEFNDEKRFETVPDDIIKRKPAVSPNDPLVGRLLMTLKSGRDDGNSTTETHVRLNTHWFDRKSHPDEYRKIGDQLVQAGELEEAERVFLSCIDNFPGHPHGQEGLARVAQLQKRWELSLFRWEECFQRFPQNIRPWWYVSKANALFGLHRLDDAERVFLDLAEKYPDDPRGLKGFANLAQKTYRFLTALDRWNRVIAHFPNNMNAFMSKGYCLLALGHFDKAGAVFENAAFKWTQAIEPHIGLARKEFREGNLQHANIIWRQAWEQFPNNKRVRNGYVHSLLDLGDFDRAHKICKGIADNNNKSGGLLIDVYLAQHADTAALDVVQALQPSAPDNPWLKQKEAGILSRMALKGVPEKLDQAVQVLEETQCRYPNDIEVQIELAFVYIRNHQNSDAARIITQLPAAYHAHPRAMKLKAWRYHHEGDENKAKQTWDDLLSLHYFPAIHSLIHSLQRLDNRRIRIEKKEILIFSMCNNELERLPWFLRHYRKLGITRFFIIDNLSSDGTTDYLLGQPDVHLFITSDSYSRAGNGMRWINELIRQYGRNHWCLYVDIDEALVFPNSENFDLRTVTEYMEQRGDSAFFAFMLDMFPYDIQSVTGCPNPDVPIEESVYFNMNHYFFGKEECPYVLVTGGISQSFGTLEFLTKTPLIYAGDNFKFINSSHAVTPARVSDVTGVLLRYKLCGDFSVRARNILKHDCVPATNKRYKLYSEALNKADDRQVLVGSKTKRFFSSQQLVELDLINCPDDFFCLDPDTSVTEWVTQT